MSAMSAPKAETVGIASSCGYEYAKIFLIYISKSRGIKSCPTSTYKNGLCKTHKPKLLLKIDRTLEK